MSNKKIKIDPVTRIEGHLAIETNIENGKVVDARVAGRMYRGFEKLLLGRHPVDAARITQRICGICHEVHGIAACLALEDLYGHEPTRNGRILRELILALHLVTDHIFHFYQLTLPDYLDFSKIEGYHGRDVRVEKLRQLLANSAGTFKSGFHFDSLDSNELTVEMALSYVEAINIRKRAGSGLASLGGKVPFSHSILPGGLTTDITSAQLMNFADAVDKTAEFVKSQYLPQALSLAEHFKAYFQLGRSHGNFYGNSCFSLTEKPMYTSGVLFADGSREDVTIEKISEAMDSTYLDANGEIAHNKPDAYSWVAAVTYNGLPMEVGPLARLLVKNDREFLAMLKPFGQKQVGSSVMERILARAFEADRLCEYLLNVIDQYTLGEPTINQIDMSAKPTGVGKGMSVAARGALNHQVTSQDGKVTEYKLQVPSAWNFGPTVKGRAGTVEQALLDTRVESRKANPGDKDTAVEIGRIVRSFDPCLACAIH